MPIKDYFTGTDLWKTLLLVSGYIFLIILMFCLVGRNFEIILPLLFGYCVWIAVAFTLMREQKIRNLEKYGGMKILTGPLDEEEDKGEIVEFEVGKITRYYQLPKGQRESIIELVRQEQGMINEMDRRENIMYRINRADVSKGSQKQLSYQVVKEVDKIEESEEMRFGSEEEGSEEYDIEEDDLIDVDHDFMDDLIKFPKDEDLENNKKGKYNGKKVELKKEE